MNNQIFNKKILTVVTRDSELAIKQVNEVFELLSQKIQYNLLKVKSYGDKHKEISLIENSQDDIFTKELDEMLLNNKNYIAVHSAKDVPLQFHSDLEIVALTDSFDKTDALVSRDNYTLTTLPKGSRVGTSSLQRKNQLLAMRDDLNIVSIRGTIKERLDYIKRDEADAVIVATCALKRLGLDELISDILPFETHPLQGNLIVMANKDNKDIHQIKKLFYEVDIRKMYGKVYLIGGGPGDPSFLTLKAFNILKKIDYIFYDDLTDDTFLKKFRAKKVYVGKRKGKQIINQDSINGAIYQKILCGYKVARLKGGDPLIFGRGGEEIDYFTERLVNIEVVPGITSALAAASLTGIPLTHRDVASSLSFCIGHSINELKIPSGDTLVFYMSSSNLKSIAQKIVNSGKKSVNTPVAIVRNVSYSDQSVVITTLDRIIKEDILAFSPSIIIVGDVVNRYNPKNSINDKPKILYTGTDLARYNDLGTIFWEPMIKIVGIKKPNFDIVTLQNYNWLIFTSKFGVKYFFNYLHKNNFDSRSLKDIKVISIGKVTSDALKKFGIISDYVSPNESSDSIIDYFCENGIKDQKILLPCSSLSRTNIKDNLKSLNNSVDMVTFYKNIKNIDTVKRDLTSFDGVIFTSPSTVRNFKQKYKNISQNIVIYAKDGITYQVTKEEFIDAKIEKL